MATPGPQSSAQGNPPGTSQCPAGGYLEGAEAHTHCPASAAAALTTCGEKHNHSPVILPHFRECSAHCGVTQSVRTAHSSLLSLLPIVTGNLFKPLAAAFISKRTQLLPKHYFYFFYCLNYSLNCYKIKKILCPSPGFRSFLLKEVFSEL